MTVGPAGPDPGAEGLWILNAGNQGPFTLDGTRTYIVGRDEVAVIDPGPIGTGEHLRALAQAVVLDQPLAGLLFQGVHPVAFPVDVDLHELESKWLQANQSKSASPDLFVLILI